ncbi:MAG: cellulase family glycosylhydrolase [Spirochaetales bacterium]|nr:cellulase family glycosylhydrolase [Spirochaetales bacterium]
MIRNYTIIFAVAAFLMCLPVIVFGETITLDYSFDGEGVKSLTLDASVAFYINCWNTDSVTVNGVDKTNTYSRFGECGTYVIEYSASVPYSHIEVRADGTYSGEGEDPTPVPTSVPTSTPTQVSGSGPVSEYGQLGVNGSHIVSASNNIIQLKGFSSHGLQWFPYVTGGNGTLEHLVECFDIQVLRIAMYAYEWDLGRSQWAGYLGVHPNLYNDQVKPLIQDAINNGIYIIVDWHIHWNPSDPNNQHWTPNPYTNEAKTFFSMVAQEFGSYKNVIYEVINEPGNGISWSQVKTHANEVISAIRQHDPDNIILVPSPIWGQDPATASNDPLLDSIDADNDGNTSEKAPNVAYTIHFYAMSHNFRSNADQAMSNGIALFATEWGVSDYSGDGYIDISQGGPADQWTDWMEANSISWTAWSFCNKGESSAALEPYTYDNVDNEARWATNEVMSGYSMQSGPWDDSVIKDSGEWLRDKMNNGASPPTAEPTPDPTPELSPQPTQVPTPEPPEPIGGGEGDSFNNPFMIPAPQTETIIDLSNGYCWVGFPQIINGSQINSNGGEFSIRIENESGTVLKSTSLTWSTGGIRGEDLIKIVLLDGNASIKLIWW